MDLRTPWPSPQLKEDYDLLLEKITEQYAKTPEEIAETVKTLHPDLSSPLRYVYARAFEEVLTGLSKTPRATYDTVCRTGLIGTLLEIALDPRLYMFHDPTSSYYHPQLGVSLRSLDLLPHLLISPVTSLGRNIQLRSFSCSIGAVIGSYNQRMRPSEADHTRRSFSLSSLKHKSFGLSSGLIAIYLTPLLRTILYVI